MLHCTMTPLKFCLILCCACLVKCHNTTQAGQSGNKTSEPVYKDMEGRIIDKSLVQEMCARKTCITKCCPKGYFISYYNYERCVNNPRLQHFFNFTISTDYSMVDVYSIDNAHRTIEKTSRNVSEASYYTLHNTIYQKPGSSILPVSLSEYYLIQDGSSAKYIPNRYKRYAITKPLEFCIDLKVNPINKTGDIVLKLLTLDHNITPEMRESITKYLFTATTMLISCFFLLLTLLVYLLLPHLRTIGGKILMALVSTLALSYLVKAVINLGVIAEIFDAKTCTGISTLFYFAILSSFFWMNVMSFNLFWTLRGTRKSREIHRRGENHKFIMYCLYAYGTPLILTIIATVIDQADVSPDVIKPFFASCQNKREELALYLFIPVGILIFSNCLLFAFTAYNIWLTKKEVTKNKESRNTKQNSNNFELYLKLSIIMGVSWLLESVQFTIDLPLWLYIIMNAYNVLIGVAIFFLFVFKKDVLCKLCKKFNIKCKFVDNMQMSQYSRTETSRAPGSTKSNTSQKYDKAAVYDEKPLSSVCDTLME